MKVNPAVQTDANKTKSASDAPRSVRQKVWVFFSEPESSKAASSLSFFIMFLIVCSSTTFLLESDVNLMGYEDAPDEFLPQVFYVIEVVCISAFSLEYVARLLCCPQRVWKFMIEFYNLIDLLAVLPFYVEIILKASGYSADLAISRLLRLLRLMRVFRVLKMSKGMKKLQLIKQTMKESADVLGMMVSVMFIAIILFSSLVFFFERGDWFSECPTLAGRLPGSTGCYARPSDVGKMTGVVERSRSPFISIPATFWWALVTVMTVGYGDDYPTSTGGRIIGCILAFFSIVILALPISVIASNFQMVLARTKEEEKLRGLQATLQDCKTEVSTTMLQHKRFVEHKLGQIQDCYKFLQEVDQHQLEDAAVSVQDKAIAVKKIERHIDRLGRLIRSTDKFCSDFSKQSVKRRLQELLTVESQLQELVEVGEVITAEVRQYL